MSDERKGLGRKGGITLIGMLLVTALQVFAILRGSEASVAIGSIGLMVGGFMGANSYISGKYAGQDPPKPEG